MNTAALDAVRSLYDAFARRDLDAIHAALSPDVVIEQSEALPWGGRYEGHDGFDALLGALLRRVEPVLEMGELVDAGEHVVHVGRSHGRVIASGDDYDVREIHVWGFRDGRIASFTAYVDVAILVALNAR